MPGDSTKIMYIFHDTAYGNLFTLGQSESSGIFLVQVANSVFKSCISVYYYFLSGNLGQDTGEELSLSFLTIRVRHFCHTDAYNEVRCHSLTKM